MANETNGDELAYNTRELGDLLQEHCPEDVGFALFLFHRGDGVVTYSTNVSFDKVIRVLEDWAERAKRVPIS